MRASRTDLVSVLTIIAGGVIGALLTFSPPEPWSPSDNVPAAVRHVPVHDGQSIVFESNTGRVYRFRTVNKDPVPVEILPNGQWIAYRVQPLIYIDDVRIGTSFPESLDPDDVASIEFVKGDAAFALYGEEAYAGVYRISLKTRRHRR